jgi:crotonobetainyl-CoA:carnitine CoA-transferase CaiB-like acyl-CoA transferase
MTGPLANIRVLDLSRILAGPLCCQLLADLGADVVKVERPGAGDDTRHWGPPFVDGDGPSAYYLSCNRNKRSLTLDLEHAAARPLLEALIRRADVLVENFLPKDLEKFGLTPQRLAEINPRLVTCSISGYGRTGTLAQVPGYDLVVQATSGLMAITGETDGAPMKVGVAMSDIITGLYAAISTLAGLRARDQGAERQHFDLALADCTLASLVNVAQSTMVTREAPRRWGNAHPQIVPYEVFATADGHLVLGIGNDRQWADFCAAVERPAWARDPRYATNPARVVHRDVLVPEVARLMSERTNAQWQAMLSAARVPHAPVLGVDRAIDDPQTAARQMVVEVDDSAGHRYRLLTTPIHWPGRDVSQTQPPPALGEHNRAVLRDWLSFDDAELAQVEGSGALGSVTH